MDKTKVQFLLTLVFIIGFFLLLGGILLAEFSDSFNMKKGGNSLIEEVEILIGLLAGILAQIINFWFNKGNSERTSNTPNNTENED